MMADYKDLLAKLIDGDESAIKEVQDLLQGKDKALEAGKALRDRDIRVGRDESLAKDYPRAIMAFNKGHLALPDDPSDEALTAALKAKEAELADLGVAVPSAAAVIEAEQAQAHPGAVWDGTPAPVTPQSANPGDTLQRVEKGLKGEKGFSAKDFADAIYQQNREDPSRQSLRRIVGQFESEAHPDSAQ